MTSFLTTQFFFSLFPRSATVSKITFFISPYCEANLFITSRVIAIIIANKQQVWNCNRNFLLQIINKTFNLFFPENPRSSNLVFVPVSRAQDCFCWFIFNKTPTWLFLPLSYLFFLRKWFASPSHRSFSNLKTFLFNFESKCFISLPIWGKRCSKFFYVSRDPRTSN